MLFPQLCVPTGGLEQLAGRTRCVSRTAMMPKRRRTRAQNRANYVAAQRRHNRAARQPGEDGFVVADDEPPPF